MKEAVQTYVMVEGRQVAANLQPDGMYDLQGAYKLNKGKIVIDIDIAREIARDKIRQARAKHFAANDAAFMRAQQTGKATTSMKTRGEKLRDAPADPRIDAAATPADLLHAMEAIIEEMEQADA